MQVTLLSVLTAGGSAILDPLTLKILIDSLEGGDLSFFVLIGLAFIIISILMAFIRYRVVCKSKALQNSIHETTVLDLSEAFFKKDTQIISRNGQAYYINRIHDEPRELSQIGGFFASSISRVVQLIVSLMVVLYLSWKITLLLLFVVPVLVFLAKHFNSKIKITEHKRLETDAQFKSILGGFVGSAKFVKLMAGGKSVLHLISNQLKIPLIASYKNSKLGSKFALWSSIFFSISEIIVIIAAGTQVIAGNITIGTLFAFLRSYHMIMGAVDGISSSYPYLIKLSSTIERYDEFKRGASSNSFGNIETKTFNKNNSQIKLNNVSFGYATGPNIIRELNIDIKKGEKVLLTGKNGAGKTTLCLLICGLLGYKPSTGEILPKPHNVSAFLPGLALSPVKIKDLILNKSSNYWSAIIYQEVLAKLGLKDLINANSEGLSEGQKAKVRLALTLSKNSEVYIFDEPLAFVDFDSKQTVSKLINEYTFGKTIICITHESKEIFEPYDQVIELDNNNNEAGNEWKRTVHAE